MIGRMIQEVRISCHISLKQLTDGLCSIGMLKKYESGEKWPDLLLASALWQRLGKSIDKFDIFLDQDEYNLAKTRASIQEQIRRGQFKKAAAELYAYQPQKQSSLPLHRAFVFLQWADLFRLSGAAQKKQQQAVLDGLNQTIHCPIRPEIVKERRFCMLELLLLQRHALLLEEKFPEEALQWYCALEDYFDLEKNNMDYDYADKYKLLPSILYRHALSCFHSKFYNTAFQLTRRGLWMLEQLKHQGALFVKLKELEFEILKASAREVPACEMECLRLMLESIGENKDLWLENCYPNYTEYFLFSVNRTIRERRLSAGITKQKLPADLCDMRTLTAIESGQRQAHTKNKTALLKRLGLSTWKFDAGLITRRYSDFRKISAMMNAYYEKDDNRAEQLYQELTTKLDLNEVTNYQFCQYWGLNLNYRKNKLTKEEYHARLRMLLTDTLQNTGWEGRGECILTWNEREMFRVLAWSPTNEETEEIQSLLEGQYKCFMEEPALQSFFPNDFNTLLYFLGKRALVQHDFTLSKYYLDTALNQMYCRQNDFCWGALLFQRFRLDEECTPLYKNTPAQEIPALERDSYFRFLRYSYAVDKLYLKDKINLKFIERYIQKHYGDLETVLYGLI